MANKGKKKSVKPNSPKPTPRTSQQEEGYVKFRNIWVAGINKNVEHGLLQWAYNDALNRGFSVDYILFVLTYCIDNKKPLHYPAGFKFYLDKPFIKEAYEQKKVQKARRVKIDFAEVRKQQHNEPTFTPPESKPTGFISIFKD